MLQTICHRINRLEDLRRVPPGCGVEIDLRSNCQGQTLYLQHDPFVEGESFERFLAAYVQRQLPGPLILNTKEDGLESRLLQLLQAAGVQNFFFLDTALPTLIKCLGKGLQQHLCLRISCFEPLSVLDHFAAAGLPLPAWAWADCFFAEPPPVPRLQDLRRRSKICLVSPELQGADARRISDFLLLRPQIDAVCSKRVDLWSAPLSPTRRSIDGSASCLLG